MNNNELNLKITISSYDFILNEAERILEKYDRSRSTKTRKKLLLQMEGIKNKIAFEKRESVKLEED